MDINVAGIETMSETELRELLRNAQESLERLVAKRARATLKEAKRMAAEVGFEAVFTKVGKTDVKQAKPQSQRAKVLPKFRNPENPDEVWSGRGRQPKWVQAALAEGQSLDDFAIPAAAMP
jgi:DNA-binding protein H-NS